MNIEIVSVREGEKRQVAFFKLTHNSETYEWHGTCPKEADPQAHFEAMEGELLFLILQKMYRKGEEWADWQRFQEDGMTKAEAMQAWIADGCRNIVGYEDEEKTIPIYEVIEKKEWRSTHPASFKKHKLIDAADIPPGLKNLLKDVI